MCLSMVWHKRVILTVRLCGPVGDRFHQSTNQESMRASLSNLPVSQLDLV